MRPGARRRPLLWWMDGCVFSLSARGRAPCGLEPLMCLPHLKEIDYLCLCLSFVSSVCCWESTRRSLPSPLRLRPIWVTVLTSSNLFAPRPVVCECVSHWCCGLSLPSRAGSFIFRCHHPWEHPRTKNQYELLSRNRFYFLNRMNTFSNF